VDLASSPASMMKRATRINLILIGIVAVLGLVTWWQVNREVAQFEPPLSALDPATVKQVRVSCLQCVARRFERLGEHWQMREPYDLPADDAQVARLLSIAATPVRSRRALTSLDARKIGLAPALLSLALDNEHFDIGTTDAFHGDRFVRVGDTIAMVPDRFSPFLVAAPASELDRHLLPRGTVLASLRINDQDRTDLIDAWTVAVAVRITASSTPADAAGTRIDLQLGDGAMIRYQIIRSAAGVVARRSEPALDYALSAEQASVLLGDAEAATP